MPCCHIAISIIDGNRLVIINSKTDCGFPVCTDPIFLDRGARDRDDIGTTEPLSETAFLTNVSLSGQMMLTAFIVGQVHTLGWQVGVL